MAQIVAPAGLRTPQDIESAFADLANQMNTALEQRALPAYTVANLPPAKVPYIEIVVPDASSGPLTKCMSDGTDWIDETTGIAVTT